MFERAQYALTFSVIAVMLYVAGFPVFFLLFLLLLGYFLWKVFSSDGTNVTRRIFEFYLTSYEILRSDDRKWFGFEVKEAIALGESIVKKMPQAPPLVHFVLGALYDKAGDRTNSLRYLEKLDSGSSLDEMAVTEPSDDLRDYVRVLRKIERSPAQAPQTSAAFRSLERMRRNRYQQLLEKVRGETLEETGSLPAPALPEAAASLADVEDTRSFVSSRLTGSSNVDRQEPERKTISEVLHDIYDQNVQ